MRSLGERGVRPILLLEPCDLRFCCVRFSKYIAKIHYLESLEDGLRVLREEYGNEAPKPIVLNAGDPSMCLLDAHYEELKDHFHIFNAREQGRISFFMDKSAQFPVAEKCGLNLIKTWRVNGSKCGEQIEQVAFPCLTKGNNSTSSGKGDMFVCQNINELKNCLRPGVDYLIQEYIEKDYELCAVGFSWNHGEDVFIPAVVRKIRDYMDRQSVYIRLDDIRDYPTLDVDAIKRFVKTVGYEGIFSLEFLCKDGKYYFLEANLRNDACCYIYTAAGINYPYLWCLYNTSGLEGAKLYSRACQLPIHLINEDDIYDVLEGKVGFLRWLREYVVADGHVYTNIHDLRPALFYLWVHIRQAFKKGLRKLHLHK